MVHEGWLTNSYQVDDELVQRLIPRLVLSNSDWYYVKNVQDIEGNNKEFLTKVKTYIRNLKKDSMSLDAAIGHAIAARKPPPNIITDVSSQQQKQGSQDQTPCNLSENLGQQEQAQPNASSLKKVKIAATEANKAADHVSANLENFRKRNYSEKQIELIDNVLEMEELFTKIKTNRREFKALQKRWEKLQAGTIQFTADPFEDSE